MQSKQKRSFGFDSIHSFKNLGLGLKQPGRVAQSGPLRKLVEQRGMNAIGELDSINKFVDLEYSSNNFYGWL